MTFYFQCHFYDIQQIQNLIKVKIIQMIFMPN